MFFEIENVEFLRYKAFAFQRVLVRERRENELRERERGGSCACEWGGFFFIFMSQ